MTDRTERAPSAFRLNLEQQKNRAKDLLRAGKAGDAEALARLDVARRNSLAPNSAAARQSMLKLADAQLVIARELRFASWAKLKAHIESMEGQRAAINSKLPPLDGDLKTLHIRCGHDIKDTLVEGGFVGDYLREQTDQDKLVSVIVLHPDHDAFIVFGGAMEKPLTVCETFQFALIGVLILELLSCDEAGHQLVAVRALRHGTHTIGNRVYQSLASSSLLS